MTEPAPAAEDGALIAGDVELEASIDALGDVVGVDTEFMRVRTFHPIPALYQLAGERGVALVDAQAPASYASLRELLLDPARTKVMHACSEDFEVLARHLDLRPVCVVDTQVAHAFLGSDYSASYATLAEHYLGVTLHKHETRSDWLQRPLSAEQLAYAREDAAHLEPIWRRQRRLLDERGRLAWFEEEMAHRLAAPVATPDTWYRTLKGISALSERQLAVLRAVVAWREREARRRDLPRHWLMANEPLLAMARLPKLDQDAVAALLPKRSARRFGGKLMAAHRQGLEDPSPPPRPPPPLPRRDGETVRRLRGIVNETAQRLGMAPELLARRRDLEAALRHHRATGELPARFLGWRAVPVGDALRAALEDAR